MSGGTGCECAERAKPIESRRWVVTARNSNHSAFSGYRETWSRYSEIRCLECGRYWRTSAKYVTKLRDATRAESSGIVSTASSRRGAL